MESSELPRSTSRPRPSSRPTTPLRPSSRSSIREVQGFAGSLNYGEDLQPAINALEPQFAELADSMADLEANFMHFQLMHESLSRFSESFASFLYGLNMNAFCVDFPETPIPDSFRRAGMAEGQQESALVPEHNIAENDGETTFLTTDTSFIDNPTAPSRPTPKHSTPAASSKSLVNARRGSTSDRYSARGTARGRPSGLARARGRGIR